MATLYPIQVDTKLESIHCFIEGDGPGAAEPYLWTVFFKIDGDTCVLNSRLKLVGKAIVQGTTGDHKNLLRDNVDVGYTIPIPPSLGEFSTILRPIPSENPTFGVFPGFLGCLAVLLEEDNIPDGAIAKGHQALNEAVQVALDRLITELSIVHREPSEEDIKEIEHQISATVEAAVRDNVSVWEWLTGGGDMDDTIGSASFRQSLSLFNYRIEHADEWNSTISLEHTFGDDNENREGRWELRGRMIPSLLPPPGDLFPGDTDNTWLSLQGKFGGTPALALLEYSTQIFTRGSGQGSSLFGHVDKVWRNENNRWLPFGNTLIDSSPVAISSANHQQVDVFARGTDGALWHLWRRTWGFTPSGQDWVSLQGQLQGTPAVSQGSDTLFIITRWIDNTVWYLRRTSGGWSTWSPLGDMQSYRLADSPVGISLQDDIPRVLARSQNNELLYFDLNGWRSLGGQIKSIPAAVSWGGNRIDVFACGMDDAVYHIFSEDSVSWSGWESLGGKIAAPVASPQFFQREFSPSIAAVSKNPNRIDVFVRAPIGSIFRKTWNGEQWIDWLPVGSVIASAGPVAMTRRIGGGDLPHPAAVVAVRDRSGAILLAHL